MPLRFRGKCANRAAQCGVLMNENPKADQQACRPCWQNCGVEADAEILAIDRMEDAIAPPHEHMTRIRELITRFEACYHEADKEAERIVKAISRGRCPKESKTRPPKRKTELENSCRILSQWCEDPPARRPWPSLPGLAGPVAESYCLDGKNCTHRKRL